MIKKIFVILVMIVVCGCTTVKTETVYKSVYPDLPELESPLILSNVSCKFSLPENPNSNIFIGFDKENYKCYLKNQEINREQKLLYEKFIEQINQERRQWKEMNNSVDK